MDLRNRLRKLEQNARPEPMGSDERCICFPMDEQPCFGSEKEKQTALELLCPVHGRRFRGDEPTVYKSAWLREAEKQGLSHPRSEQFLKARSATEKGRNE
jgi:hypothetical protein